MFYRFIITPITYYVNRVLFLFLFSFKEMIFQHLLTLFHIFLIIMPIITIGFKRVVLHVCPNHLIRAKVCITKSEIYMRTWRSPMSAASQGAFVVIPEISRSDISQIIETGKLQVKGFTAACFFVRSVGHSYRLLPTTAPSHKRTRCSPTPENIAQRLCRAC